MFPKSWSSYQKTLWHSVTKFNAGPQFVGRSEGRRMLGEKSTFSIQDAESLLQ